MPLVLARCKASTQTLSSSTWARAGPYLGRHWRFQGRGTPYAPNDYRILESKGGRKWANEAAGTKIVVCAMFGTGSTTTLAFITPTSWSCSLRKSRLLPNPNVPLPTSPREMWRASRAWDIRQIFPRRLYRFLSSRNCVSAFTFCPSYKTFVDTE